MMMDQQPIPSQASISLSTKDVFEELSHYHIKLTKGKIRPQDVPITQQYMQQYILGKERRKRKYPLERMIALVAMILSHYYPIVRDYLLRKQNPNDAQEHSQDKYRSWVKFLMMMIIWDKDMFQFEKCSEEQRKRLIRITDVNFLSKLRKQQNHEQSDDTEVQKVQKGIDLLHKTLISLIKQKSDFQQDENKTKAIIEKIKDMLEKEILTKKHIQDWTKVEVKGQYCIFFGQHKEQLLKQWKKYLQTSLDMLVENLRILLGQAQKPRPESNRHKDPQILVASNFPSISTNTFPESSQQQDQPGDENNGIVLHQYDGDKPMEVQIEENLEQTQRNIMYAKQKGLIHLKLDKSWLVEVPNSNLMSQEVRIPVQEGIINEDDSEGKQVRMRQFMDQEITGKQSEIQETTQNQGIDQNNQYWDPFCDFPFRFE